VVTLGLDQTGKVFEVKAWDDSVGMMRKVRGFRYYESARKFAEDLALEKRVELRDFVEKSVLTVDGREIHQVNPEDRLRRAIFGDVLEDEEV